MEQDNERFEKYGDIMIDIETLGTRMDSVILEIAAVEFNRHTGEIGEIFDKKIDIASQVNSYNRKIDARTLKWWLEQSNEAKKNIFGCDDILRLCEALYDFKSFYNRCDNSLYSDDDQRTVTLWGNGSIFDLGILQHAFETVTKDEKIPWKFWAVNDVRTVVALNPSVKKNCTFDGTQHCAVDDCKHEIKYLVDTLKTIQIVEDTKKEISIPRFLDIILPDIIVENDCEDFPYKNFLDNDGNVKMPIDLLEKRFIGWKSEYGDCRVFIKAVDSGTYVIRDNNNNELYRIDKNYVPNGVVPPTDGFGDYIDFTISEDGTISDWYDYNDLDITAFNKED